LSFGGENLDLYFNLNFILMKEHNFRLSEIEDMVPWERLIYKYILIKYLKEKEELLKNKKG